MIENRSPGATERAGNCGNRPLQASAAAENDRSGIAMGPGIVLAIAFWGLDQGGEVRT